jgi:hypothetical protein
VDVRHNMIPFKDAAKEAQRQEKMKRKREEEASKSKASEKKVILCSDKKDFEVDEKRISNQGFSVACSKIFLKFLFFLNCSRKKEKLSLALQITSSANASWMN